MHFIIRSGLGMCQPIDTVDRKYVVVIRDTIVQLLVTEYGEQLTFCPQIAVCDECRRQTTDVFRNYRLYVARRIAMKRKESVDSGLVLHILEHVLDDFAIFANRLCGPPMPRFRDDAKNQILGHFFVVVRMRGDNLTHTACLLSGSCKNVTRAFLSFSKSRRSPCSLKKTGL